MTDTAAGATSAEGPPADSSAEGPPADSSAEGPPADSSAEGPPGEVVVEEATSVTEELMDAMGRLVPQLSRTGAVPTAEQMGEILSSPATVLLVARDAGGVIVGSLTLALFRIPTGVRAWVEDVVVDESARGVGVGAALTEEALRRAVAAGARSVDLTSRPTREAANRLYSRLGFEPRETNVYRWSGEARPRPR